MTDYIYSKEKWPDYDTGCKMDLLMAGGDGNNSYYFTSLIGSLCKASHGLITTKSGQDNNFYTILEAMPEWIQVGEHIYDIETSRRQENGKTTEHDGHKYLTEVRYDGTVSFHYECGECMATPAKAIDLSSKISMISDGTSENSEPELLPEFEFTKHIAFKRDEDTLAIGYDFINNSDAEAKIVLTPWLNYRKPDATTYKRVPKFEWITTGDTLSLVPRDDQFIRLDISISSGEYIRCPENTLYGSELTYELINGREGLTSHHTPFDICTSIPAHSRCSYSVIFTVIHSEVIRGMALLMKSSDLFYNHRSAHKIVQMTKKYYDDLYSASPYSDDTFNSLLLAADQFFYKARPIYDETVKKTFSVNKPFILTGFPYSDIDVRSLLIGYSGLVLYTRRYDEASRLLLDLSMLLQDGLLPDKLDFNVNAREYRHADLSLLYIIDVYKYLKALRGDSSVTNDQIKEVLSFIYKGIFPTMVEIIDSFSNCEEYPIVLLENGLIHTGSEEMLMTYMDETNNDGFITPRIGCTVEMNVLWYNALMVMEYLCKIFKVDASYYIRQSDLLKASFYKAFWNPTKNCLYDYVVYEPEINDYTYRESAVRPNQILAVSLPFDLLMAKDERQIVECVDRKLFVKYGLRTLSTDHVDYSPDDTCRHTGATYSFYLGAFLSAYRKVNSASKDGKEKLAALYPAIMEQMQSDGIVGFFSERFNSDSPNITYGGNADAASIGELIRSYVEDQILINK